LIKILKWFAFVVCITSLAVYFAYYRWNELCLPVCGQSEKRDVFIKYGIGVREIAKLLENEGVIRSQYVFLYLAWKDGSLRKMQPGEYELDCSLPPEKHLEDIVAGKVKLYKIVIPEGSNLFDVKRIFEESGIFEDSDLLAYATDREFLRNFGFESDSAEGFMFPDTYHFPRGLTTKKALSIIFKHFWDVWEKDGFSKKLTELGLDVTDVITLASIVEKETASSEERGLIAGVFWNRLKRDIPLQADPTVTYGLLTQDEPLVKRLTKKDLQTLHPYNTYLLRGLPKGPIANPGKEAIKAVLYPTKTDYIYFVSRNDGTHQFSRKLSEHNMAVNLYQRADNDDN